MSRFSGVIGEEYVLFEKAVPYIVEFESKIHETLGADFEGNALEIGCGNGFTTARIIDFCKNLKITCVDNEKKMTEQFCKNFKKEISEGKINLVFGDALEIINKIESKKFDAVVSALTIHNFDKEYRHDFLKEVFRILKKRGLFINADKYAHDDTREHERAIKWQWQKYAEVFDKKLAEEWIKHDKEDEKSEKIMKEPESILALKNIGFSEIKIIYRKNMHAVIKAKK